jgi:protein ImuB
MSIPSYDDLTPPIPDIRPSDAVPQLALFLRAVQESASGGDEHSDDVRSTVMRPAQLFACLRGPADADATLRAIARDFSPRVMRVAAGEFVVDVSGLGRLVGMPGDIARELRRAVTDASVDALVAVMPTQAAARVLARRPGATATGPLPVTVLRDLETLPPATTVRDRDRPYETLERWGIATLADLAALPAADLSSRLGRRGVALQRLSRGLDPQPFVPDADVPRFIGRLELEWPIDALEPLSFVFARLLEPLSASLERADRGAAAIRLDLRLTDRSVDTRLLQLPSAMREARVLRTLLLLELESRPPCGADGRLDVSIDIVTIEIDPAPSRITQFSLLERAVPSPETLSTLVARLSALVGESRVGSPSMVDSHEPGAFAMERLTVAPRHEAASPVIDAGVHVLRRQRIPPAIRVNVSGGRPVYLAPSRRGIPSGAIVQSAGPWRASGGWWIADDAASPRDPGRVSPTPRRGEGGWDRSEWDVALARGEVCRVFQDRRTGRWFFEGLYD